ncbi:MAG TPA: NAD-dependent epimerase/dehydratase family protein, partial [Actinobacteria bacterium]|nr:NAD-dependent epimerase/dehydratase family protein [Actinomycetota bacterium]
TMELDRLEFARYLLDARVDTVVHLQTVDRSVELGARRAHEEAVIGAQTLFGAIARSETIRQVVVRSDAAIYGAGPRNPSVMAEEDVAVGRLPRYARDLRDMERLVVATQATHPEVVFTVLRLAPLLGPARHTPLARFLTLPSVPTILGFDPRLQFLHEEDAVAAFVHVVDVPVPGVFNVGAPGQLYLSRVLRLGRRPATPLPQPLFDRTLRGLKRGGLGLPGYVVSLLRYGRVMELGRMARVLGFEPARTCRQTVLDTYGRLPAGWVP